MKKPEHIIINDDLDILNKQLKEELVEKQRTEKELKESIERYRLISSVSTDYTFSTRVLPDGSLDLNWVAGAFESISGYTVEEFKARGGWRASIHPEDLYIDDNDFSRLQEKQDTESQIRTINRKGDIVWVQVFAHPVWDEENNCLSGIYGAVRNITEQKLAEEALKSNENQLNAIFNTISDVIFLLSVEPNETYRFISVNEMFLKTTGLKKKEVINKVYTEVIPESSHELVLRKYKASIENKQTVMWEEITDYPNGRKYGLVKVSPIFNDKGICINLVGSVHDITLLRETENEIRNLNSVLEQRVIDRTRELEEKNVELDRMNKLFVGRELRMIELKDRMRELEIKLEVLSKLNNKSQ